MARTPVLRRALARPRRPCCSTLSGCGNTDSWVRASAARGWPGPVRRRRHQQLQYATAGVAELKLQWSRSVKGELGASAALGGERCSGRQRVTAGGCSLMVENDNDGRQRWCTRMVLGGGFSSPLSDGFDNPTGQPGLMFYPPIRTGHHHGVRRRLFCCSKPCPVRVPGSRTPSAEGVRRDAARRPCPCCPRYWTIRRQRSCQFGARAEASPPSWWCWTVGGSRARRRRC